MAAPRCSALGRQVQVKNLTRALTRTGQRRIGVPLRGMRKMFYHCLKEQSEPLVECDQGRNSCEDTTAQMMAQEVLPSLLAAQERKLGNLARELHDDICQRLYMLSLRIEKVAKGWATAKLSISEELEQIRQQCSGLTRDVQALSHGLHPSVLDHLGLVVAVRGFCREFSDESGTRVEFEAKDIPKSLPREVSLSLFRVIQEAIHNAGKYSGEKHFEVRLQGKPGEIELEVSDRGVGFDVTSLKSSEGLGLVSMAERIHVLNGTISIASKPNAGTRIRAYVPVGDSKAMNAAVS